MDSLQFNEASTHYNIEGSKPCPMTMRDYSTESDVTSSTVSSTVSEYENEETVVLKATSYVTKIDYRITYNTTVVLDKPDDDDAFSVISHVSSLTGQMKPTKASTLHDNTSTKALVPLIVSGDVDCDDSSFAPLNDDDDDDNSSFAPLQDEEKDDNISNGPCHEVDSQRECPFDEEDDDNYRHQRQDPPKKQSANRSPSTDDINYYNDNQFIQQKTLPGLNNSYRVVCVSFMEYNIATSVACRVLDESYRMVRPGGLLYVIDRGGCTVRKHPTMRQWLSRVRDPTVKHLIHEIETRAILQTNGFVHTSLDENSAKDDDGSRENVEIVRWIGIKY